MIDASHGNSGKDPQRQFDVVDSIDPPETRRRPRDLCVDDREPSDRRPPGARRAAVALRLQHHGRVPRVRRHAALIDDLADDVARG